MAYILEATNPLEDKIRKFEIEVLLNINSEQYERSFSSIYSQICFDSDLFQGKNEKDLEKFLLTNFTQKMVEFVSGRSYFKINEAQPIEFDMRKIRILFFLLTFNTNTKNHSDKVIKNKFFTKIKF